MSQFNATTWPAMQIPEAPAQRTVWSPAPAPVNTQTFYSQVLTQREINAVFKIQDLRLDEQAPNVDG